MLYQARHVTLLSSACTYHTMYMCTTEVKPDDVPAVVHDGVPSGTLQLILLHQPTAQGAKLTSILTQELGGGREEGPCNYILLIA